MNKAVANTKTKAKYISLTEASRLCSYSQEYLSLRARQGRLKAVKIGRNWSTTAVWLKKYCDQASEYDIAVFHGPKQETVASSLSASLAEPQSELKKPAEKFIIQLKSIIRLAKGFLFSTENRIGWTIDKGLALFDVSASKIGEIKKKVEREISVSCRLCASRWSRFYRQEIGLEGLAAVAGLSLILFFSFYPGARAGLGQWFDKVGGVLTEGRGAVVEWALSQTQKAGKLASDLKKWPENIANSAGNATEKAINLAEKMPLSVQSAKERLSLKIKLAVKKLDALGSSVRSADRILLDRIVQAPQKLLRAWRGASLAFRNASQKNEEFKLSLKSAFSNLPGGARKFSQYAIESLQNELENKKERIAATIRKGLSFPALSYRWGTANLEKAERYSLSIFRSVKAGCAVIDRLAVNLPDQLSRKVSQATKSLGLSVERVISDTAFRLSDIPKRIVNTRNRAAFSLEKTLTRLSADIFGISDALTQLSQKIVSVSNDIKDAVSDTYQQFVDYLLPDYTQDYYLLGGKETAVVQPATGGTTTRNITQIQTKTTEVTRVTETIASVDLAIINGKIETLQSDLLALSSQIKSKIDYTQPSYAPIYVPSSGIQVSGHALLTSLNVSGSAAIGDSLAVHKNASFGNPKDSNDSFDVYAGATFHNGINLGTADATILTVSGSLNSATTTITGDLTVQSANGDTKWLYIDNTNGQIGVATSSPNALFAIERQSGGTEDLFKVGTSTDDDLFVINSLGDITTAGNVTTTGSYYIGGDLTITGTLTQGVIVGTLTTTTIVGDFTVQNSDGDSWFVVGNENGVVTTTGKAVFTYAPQTAGEAHIDDSTVYINADSGGAVADANMLAIADNGTWKFRVDKEGDVFVQGNIITEGTVTQADTDIVGNLVVEGYSLLGDAPNNDYHELKGYTIIRATSTAPALSVYQSSSGDLISIYNDAAGADINITRQGSYATTDSLGAIVWNYTTDDIASIDVKRNGANTAGDIVFSTQAAGGELTERMRIDSTGQVGIGTSLPLANLDVSDSDDMARLIIERKQVVAGEHTDASILFKGYDSASHAEIFSTIYGVNVDDTSGAEKGAITFLTNNAGTLYEKMRIDNTGIGIGTTTPNALLQVARGSGETEDLFKVGTSTDDDLFVVKSDGKVGIGTGAPNNELHVGNDAKTNVYQTMQTDSRSWRLGLGYYGGDDNFLIGDTTGDRTPFRIDTSGNAYLGGDSLTTPTLYAMASGNVGIGTTTPNDLLTLGGQGRKAIAFQNGGYADPSIVGADSNGDKIIFWDGDNAKIAIGFGGDNDIWNQTNVSALDTTPAFRWFNGIGELMRISGTGNLGIGTTTPDQQLVLTGDIELASTTAADLSGIIYKENTPFIHNYRPEGGAGGNTFIGLGSGNFTMTSSDGTEGSYNTGIGDNTLLSLTTGYNNVALGYGALTANTSGSSNMGIGLQALGANTIGSGNVAIGRNALADAQSNANTAVGFYALSADTSGGSNAANGYYSLGYNTTGQYNAAYGALSLFSNKTANSSTAIGYSAGYWSKGSNNTFLGYQAGTPEGGDATSSIAIGYDAKVWASDQLAIANTSTTEPLIFGDFANDRLGLNTSTPNATFQVVRFDGGDEDLFKVGTSTDDDLFVVKSDGKVGIGVGVPTATLSLPAASTIKIGTPTSNEIGLIMPTAARFIFSDTLTGSGLSAANIINNFDSYTGLLIQRQSTGSGNFIEGKNSSGVSQFILKNDGGAYFNGNVGVGTSSPNALLQVARASGGTEELFKVGTSTDDDLFVVRSDGKVGIGTSTPTEMLNVEGNAVFTGTIYSNDIKFANNFILTEATTTQGMLWLNQNGEPIMLMDGNGYLGIGTTTPTNILTIGQGLGEAIADGWSVYSSQEYKTDITYLEETDYTDILEEIQNINIATYHWKDETADNRLNLGLIAEEAPEQLLGSDGKSISLYDYASFALAGVKAMKSETDQVKELLGIIEGEDGELTISSSSPLLIANNSGALSQNGEQIQFSLDENGYVIIDKIKVKDLEIASTGNITLPAGDDEMAGEGMVATSSDSVVVENGQVQDDSKIFVTFNANLYGASWWICEKIAGESFKICFDQTIPEPASFDYFIVQVRTSAGDDEAEETIHGTGEQESTSPLQSEPEPEPESTVQPEEEPAPEAESGSLPEEGSPAEPAESEVEPETQSEPEPEPEESITEEEPQIEVQPEIPETPMPSEPVEIITP